LEPAVVEDTVLSHQTTTGTLSVEVALGWSPIRDAPLVKSFVNLHPTEDSAHVEAVLRTLTEVAPTLAAVERARPGLVVVLHTRVTETRFVLGPNQSQVTEAVTAAVRALLSNAPVWWDRIIEHQSG